MDEQVGRIRRVLQELGIAGNTALLFASDNGQVTAERDGRPPPVGSAGFLRGGKATLLEGGIRVPALLEWPARVPVPRAVSSAWSTHDVFPTVADLLGADGELPALDGESWLPFLEGSRSRRTGAIGFFHSRERALIDGDLKALSLDGGTTWSLYDVSADPEERVDLAAERPEDLERLRREFQRQRGSWMSSRGSQAESRAPE